MSHSVLLAGAFDWNIVVTALELLPLILFLCGALIGFFKGIRKQSWADEAWLLAVGLYEGILGILQSMMGEKMNPAVPVLVAAIVCAAVSMLVFAVLRFLIHPRERKIDNKELQRILRREDEFREIEEEELEELLEEYPDDERRLKKLQKRQKHRREEYLEKMDGHPRFSSRIIGAAILGTCLLFIGSMIADALVYVIGVSPFADGMLAGLCELEGFQELLATIDPRVLDNVLIGVLMCAVYIGYSKGALSSVYAFGSVFAALAAFVLAFYLPFSPWAVEGGFLSLIAKLSSKFSSWAGTFASRYLPIALPEAILAIIGKLAAGAVLCVGLEILVAIGLFVVRKAVDLTDEVRIVGALDGFLGVVLAILICLVLFAMALFVLQLVEVIGWYSASTELFADTELLKVCYEQFGKLVEPWIQKIVGILK